MIETLEKTDLLELFKNNKLDGIAHQTNIERVMGAGFAKSVARDFPEALQALQQTKGKLGEVSSANTKHGVIFNATAQSIKGMGRKTNYEALYSSLELIEFQCYSRKKNFRLGTLHGIGCGLGGGSWKIVEAMLSQIFEESDVQLLICKQN